MQRKQNKQRGYIASFKCHYSLWRNFWIISNFTLWDQHKSNWTFKYSVHRFEQKYFVLLFIYDHTFITFIINSRQQTCLSLLQSFELSFAEKCYDPGCLGNDSTMAYKAPSHTTLKAASLSPQKPVNNKEWWKRGCKFMEQGPESRYKGQGNTTG